MKHFFIFLSILITNSSFARIKTDTAFTGRIDEIIEKKESVERNNIYLKLASGDNEELYIDDFFIVFMIEQTHKVILSDYINKPLPEEIKIKLENITIIKREINKSFKPFIKSVGKVYPDYPESEYSFDYKEINPGIPEEDYYHRYVDAPVSYTDPAKGSFKLYYELCSDYDESKPTIIIPTDGQRSLSQVGWADKYKKMFSLDYNTVTYEYRGMYASKIPLVENKNTNWKTLYEILNSDNVVEDIELIRKDLPGNKPVYILGGSGTAMMGLKYITKYHKNIKRAFLMSFFKDAKGSSEAGIIYFNNFLEDNNLTEKFRSIYQNHKIDKKQTLFLIQRLLYYDKEAVKDLIAELSEGTCDLYEKYSEQLGSMEFFIRSARKYKPWTVIFMYETNTNTSLNNMPDINYPFLKMAEPVHDYYSNSHISEPPLFKIDIPDKMQTETLLVAGTLDQVAPIHEMLRIFNDLPGSELAIFEAYHSLQSPEESRLCRNSLANIFFKTGNRSPEMTGYLKTHGSKCNFIKFME